MSKIFIWVLLFGIAILLCSLNEIDSHVTHVFTDSLEIRSELRKDSNLFIFSYSITNNKSRSIFIDTSSAINISKLKNSDNHSIDSGFFFSTSTNDPEERVNLISLKRNSTFKKQVSIKSKHPTLYYFTFCYIEQNELELIFEKNIPDKVTILNELFLGEGKSIVVGNY